MRQTQFHKPTIWGWCVPIIMVIMGDNENNCVNTTLFLLLLSIVFIVTTQPVGVQRSTSLPTQLGSGKSKPSRILKPIQFLKVCLKIVSTPKFHNWWSCSYQNDDFCVSRSFWWLWTTINAYKGVVKAHCLGVGTIWRAYVWYLMKMGGSTKLYYYSSSSSSSSSSFYQDSDTVT